MSEWIKTAERQPAIGQRVLSYRQEMMFQPVQISQYIDVGLWCDGGFTHMSPPDYWMPLPEPPEAKG